MSLLTPELLKQALPKNLQSHATQDFADKVNAIGNEPEVAEEIRNNFLTYTKVLTEGKYKTEDYLAAVTYCTFKIMGYSNKDAYAKTFPDRWQILVLRGTSAKDVSAYVAMYHKNKLVNTILEQAMIPGWLLNQDVFQRAINTQLELMIDTNVSPKVRSDAANSLLTHLKPPEVKKVEIDVSVSQASGIGDLMATMNRFAEQQRASIEGGANAREVGRTPLMIEDAKVLDAEFVEFSPVHVPYGKPDTDLLKDFGVDMAQLVKDNVNVEDVDMGNGQMAKRVSLKGSIFDKVDFDKPVTVQADEELVVVDQVPLVQGRKPSLFDPMGSDE